MSYTPLYTTVAKVCQFLSLDGTNTDIQESVLDMIEYAEWLAENYIGCSYAPSEAGVAKSFNGTGESTLTLPIGLSVLDYVYLLDANDQVVVEYTYDGAITIDATYDAIGIFSYVRACPPNPKHGVYRWLELATPGAIFEKGLQNIQVTGTWGTPDTPTGLKLGVTLIVQHLFNLREYNAFIKSEKSMDRAITNLDPSQISLIPRLAQDALSQLIIFNIGLDV